MKKANKFGGVRHGEVALIPTNVTPDGKTLPKGEYILAHSETGHHHVLEGTDFQVTENVDGRIFVQIFGDTALAHRKTHDKHRTIVLPPSILERYEMTEYDPRSEAIRKVTD